MAEWLKQKFSRPKESYNPAVEGYTQQILASQEPPDAASQQAKDSLEINIHTIEDEGLLRELDLLCISPERKYILWYDLEGHVVGQGVSPPLTAKGAVPPTPHDLVVPPHPVPWALAARVAMSKVTCTRFLTKQNAALYKNRLRNEFLKIKRTMTRDDRRLFVPFLNQIELQCLTAIDDAVDGQKMLALKTSGRNLKVKVNNDNTVGGR